MNTTMSKITHLKQTLAKAQDDLLDLELESVPMDNENHDAWNAQQMLRITACQTLVSSLQRTIELVSPSIAQTAPNETREPNKPKPNSHVVLKLAASMPKLKSNVKADTFWLNFEQTVDSWQLNATDAILLLRQLIDEHPKGLGWYGTHVYPVRNTIIMPNLKTLFYQGFLDADWQTDRLISLIEIRYLPNETVKDYTQRFASLMQSNEFNWQDTSEEKQYLKHIMFHKAPYSVQRIIGDKKLTQFDSCAELAAALNLYSGVPSDIPVLNGCARCQPQSNLKSKAKNIIDRLGDKLNPPGSLYCKKHGHCSHTTANCKNLEVKDDPNNSKKPRNDSTKTKEPGFCWNDGCSEKHSYKHMLICPFKKKDPAIRQMSIQPSAMDLDYDEESPTFCMLKSSTDAKPFIYAPVKLDNLRVQAGIDSMASVSFISPQLVARLEVKVSKVEGQVSLGSQGSSTKRIGISDPIKVSIGHQQFLHRFEVLNLHDDCQCIFGIDIFPKAGISLNGVPVTFPKEMEISPVETIHIGQEPDEIDTAPYEPMGLAEITLLLDSINKADKNYVALYTVYLLKLSDTLSPFLNSNQQISGFCNLPNSKVRIDVQGAKPVHKRQYRVEFALHSVVDDQIAE
jgi:hypothetical protein